MLAMYSEIERAISIQEVVEEFAGIWMQRAQDYIIQPAENPFSFQCQLAQDENGNNGFCKQFPDPRNKMGEKSSNLNHLIA